MVGTCKYKNRNARFDCTSTVRHYFLSVKARHHFLDLLMGGQVGNVPSLQIPVACKGLVARGSAARGSAARAALQLRIACHVDRLLGTIGPSLSSDSCIGKETMVNGYNGE